MAKTNIATFVVMGILFVSNSGGAELHLSDLPRSEPVVKADFSIRNNDKLGGFDELVPYVLASPDQDEAGSCLYMALTGIAEWWLARLNPNISRAPDGPLDLSERYLMNIAGIEESSSPIDNWRTDSIYLFNQNNNLSVNNTTYRFTKDWYLGETYSDILLAADKNTPNADFGTYFNWIDQRPRVLENSVILPKFERDVIFADPENNQWNVGIAPENIVETVKETLRVKKAPVLVIYNHNSYWHAVYIIGYNDDMDNGNCAYTERYRLRLQERIDELTRLAAESNDPVVKAAYEIRAQRAREAKSKIETAYNLRHGCTSSKGVFYIRDSIYPDSQGPIYDYNQSTAGDESPYAKKIVFKEYDWLNYFANHVSVIYPTFIK